MKATIGRRELFSVTQLRELGLHAAAGLRVDHDRLGLLVRLEQRHQLGVGGADDRVAADRDGGRLAEARRRVSVLEISVVMPPLRDITPTGPGV